MRGPAVGPVRLADKGLPIQPFKIGAIEFCPQHLLHSRKRLRMRGVAGNVRQFARIILQVEPLELVSHRVTGQWMSLNRLLRIMRVA